MKGTPDLTQTNLDGTILDQLFNTIRSRKNADPNESYSARLLSKGPQKIAQKFGEEAVECLIEGATQNSQKLIGESADVLYHLLAMWVSVGISPNEVWNELHQREAMSGLEEKASRKPEHP